MCLAQACPQIHLFTAVPLEICQILPANIHSMHTQYTYSCRNNAQLWNNENCSLPLLCDALSSVFGVYYKIVAEGLSHSHSPLLGSSLKPSETKEWNKFIIHSAWKFHNSVEWILRTNKLNLISTTKKKQPYRILIHMLIHLWAASKYICNELIICWCFRSTTKFCSFVVWPFRYFPDGYHNECHMLSPNKIQTSHWIWNFHWHYKQNGCKCVISFGHIDTKKYYFHVASSAFREFFFSRWDNIYIRFN